VTKTAATKQAASESSIYKQGSGWIFSHWDDDVQCHRVSGEMPYQAALYARKEWKIRRVEHLQGAGS
jgi:hypothetical protein